MFWGQLENLFQIKNKIKIMEKIKVAINGFGRIGRASFKIALEKPDLEIVAINDLTDPENLAYLLKYDSVQKKYGKKIGYYDGGIIVEDKKFPIFAIKEPEKLPWKDLGVDVVIESTGVFTKLEDLQKHITAGAKKVVLSAPAKGEGIPTYLRGVNDNEYKGESIISCASCTTNAIGPVIKMLDEKFGVEKAMTSTIHAYTATQSLVDGPAKKDFRRGRAGAANISPSSTGAAKATTQAYSKLKGLFDGNAYRVPVIAGSIAEVIAVLKKEVTAEEINLGIKEYSKNSMKGVLTFTEDQIVSSDIIGNSYSSIVDLEYTMVVGGNLAKVVAWYDNEWGYTERLIEEVIMVGKNNE